MHKPIRTAAREQIQLRWLAGLFALRPLSAWRTQHPDNCRQIGGAVHERAGENDLFRRARVLPLCLAGADSDRLNLLRALTLRRYENAMDIRPHRH
jgi:hypothetical protein